MPRRPIRIEKLPEMHVRTPAEFTQCIDQLARESLLAFDTEFVGEFTYRPELCLVQVATMRQLWVIDPFSVGDMSRFWELLTDSRRQVLVHAGREEIRMCRSGIGVSPANLVDLQPAAGLVGLAYPIGLAALIQTTLGHTLSKSETLTDWRKRPLSTNQLRYAFDDVRYLIPAWKRIHATLHKHQREPWATEEFAAVIRRSTEDDDPTTEKWRKVKGLSSLNRKALAVARAVVGWRDRMADRTNRPARSLLRDDVVVEIAKRPPGSPDDMNNWRGIPRGESSPLFEVIQSALRLPPSEWPVETERDYDPPNVAVLTQLLTVVMNDWATKERISPAIIATQSDIRALIRYDQASEPLPDDLTLGRGWRSEHVLPVLRNVLNGKIAVKVADVRSLNPLGVIDIA